MKLLRLEIKAFGKLRNFHLDLTDGLNTICQENGWGKSTLAAFLKAMLYGLPNTRKSDLDQNERRKYQPWEGGVFGGSLEFESRKGRFRAERTFGEREAKDTFRLFDLSDNRESNAYTSDLGTELFGIDADGFERSAYLSERSLDTKAENASVRSKLTGLLEDPDDIGAYDKAQELIDRRRRYYESRGGHGFLAETENALHQAQRELEEAREKKIESDRVLHELRDAERTVHALETELTDLHNAQLSAQRAAGLRDESARKATAIAAKSKRLREIENAFGGGPLPTEEELRNNQHLLVCCRADLHTLQTVGLTAEEQARLRVLSDAFPNGVPTAAERERADTLENELRQAEIRLAGIGEPSVLPSVRRIYKIGIPSAETLSRAEQALEQAEIARINRTVRARRRIPLPIPLLFLICGVCLLALLAVPQLGAASLPLGIGGGAFLIAAIVTLALGKAPQRAQSPTSVQTSNPLSNVLALLNRYGLHEDGANPREELAQLRILSEQATAFGAAQRKTAADRTEWERKRSFAHAELAQFFAKFGGTDLPSDRRIPALAALYRNADELSALRRRDTEQRAQRAELETRIAAQKAQVQAFFARLTAVSVGHTPEDRQDQMERLCLEYRNLQSEVLALQRESEQFYQANRAILDAPPPAIESSDALQVRLRSARVREQTLRTRRDRLRDETAALPDLTARVASLERDQSTARADFETLRTTAALLERSKNALSTRYLGGMQTALENRLSQLRACRDLQAEIDAQLNLKIRDGGLTRDMASASRGTRDLLKFCARLALTEVLFSEGEQPFLLLDDPFLSFDEPHLKAALAYLERLGQETQILYLVCHRARGNA